MDSSYFQDVEKNLSNQCEVICYTQASDPEDGMVGLLDELHNIIKRLDPERDIFLLGHSFGGALALEYSLNRFTHNISGLILSNWIYNMSWLKEFKKNHPDRLERQRDDAPNDADDLYKQSTLNLADLYFAESHLNQGRKILSRVQYSSRVKEEIWNKYLGGFDLLPKLKNVSVPVLSLSGDCDRIVPAKYVSHGAMNLPNCCHLTLQGAGHFPFVEKFDEFTNIVMSSINQWRTC